MKANGDVVVVVNGGGAAIGRVSERPVASGKARGGGVEWTWFHGLVSLKGS
jgi:hypothetical protein